MFLKAHKARIAIVLVLIVVALYLGAFYVIASPTSGINLQVQYSQTVSQSLNNTTSSRQLGKSSIDSSTKSATGISTAISSSAKAATAISTTHPAPAVAPLAEQPINLVPNASFDSGLEDWSISRCTLDPEIAGLPEAICIFSSGPLRRSAASEVSLSTAPADDTVSDTVGDTVDAENADKFAQLETENGSIRLRSSLMPVEPGALVRFSVQAKAATILDSGGWHKGGISLSTHGKGGKKIRHYDFASFSGSFDWKKMNGELFIPKDVQFVRLNLELRQTSGLLWVDDVVLHTIPLPDFEALEQSVAKGIEPQADNAEFAPSESPLPVVTSLKPAHALRGAIVAGSWFNSAETIERFKEARFNFAWSQGSFLNQKMQYLWREPLHANEKRQIREWTDMCEAASIRCYLSLSPRGRSAERGTIYSSAEDIDMVLQRFDELYQSGVRYFGLSFDDLHRFAQGELLPIDAARFNHMGDAHAYFVGEVYAQLTDRYDDVHLMIVPLYYDLIGNLGNNEEAYLYALGELPPEVGMLSSTVFIEDAETAIRTTGRRHVVWDNQFAFAYENGGAGEYIAPLQRPILDESMIAGYAFLPLMKSREDAALVSWQSVSDYAWEPAKYDSNRSLQRAITNYLVSSEHAKASKTP